MIKEKDEHGYPLEAGWSDDYNSSVCDNCGEPVDTDDDDAHVHARVIYKDSDGEMKCHHYYFDDTQCLDEFCSDNGLKKEFNDFSNLYELTLTDPVKDAVKSIDLEPASDEPADAAEQPASVDPVHERKVVECWKEVVSQAQEIEKLARTIVETNETLKGLKKEYEALVNRQNSFILTNGNGIQMTFEDCEDDVIQSDPLAWRDEPVTTLTNYGLTDKQADKAQEAFGTLGRLQDWLCADYRDKQPGIGQALQDKLTDALNKYTEMIYKTLPNEENDKLNGDEENNNESAR